MRFWGRLVLMPPQVVIDIANTTSGHGSFGVIHKVKRKSDNMVCTKFGKIESNH
jgi:hypothetical protein